MAKKIDVNGLDHYHDKVSAMLASEYSSSKTYAVGDYCFHAGTLYECTTAITTAEAWTSGHWTAAKLADDTSALKTALNYYTEVSGTTPSITAEDGKLYVCGMLESLSFTPPAKGMTGVVFTCGTTPTVLTLPNTVTMPEDWDGTLVGGLTYELNFLDQRGVYQIWA